MPTVFIVDDDPDIRSLLSQYLTRNHYSVTAYSDAESVLATDLAADCIVLDVGLPGVDGLEACRQIRSRSSVPIIMLTAASDDVDRILGLELGADDYMGKPFNPRELLARIRAMLRRGGQAAPDKLLLDQRCATWGDNRVELTGAEYSLMECLLQHSPDLASRDQLSHALHGRNSRPFDRSIDTGISRLRQKLGSLGAPDVIRSVRGKGYVLVQPS